jgi:L-ascorbate metabolism protein UlaG (beta-lactamase superfamily)
MMRVFSVALIAFLAVAPVATRTSADTVDVTYVGNTGFMIEAGTSKILVDAVFDEGWDLYLVPSRATRNDIRMAEGPFADVDAILVTHWHDDHFDASLVATHLARNPSCRLLAPPQVVARLKDCQEFGRVETQIIELAPGIGESVDVEVRGADITAIGMSHSQYMLDGADKHRDVENIGYVVTVGGATLMHCGDATFDLAETFIESSRLEEREIDVLFVQFWDRSPGAVKVVNEVIRPGKVIATHLPPADFDQIAPVFRGTFRSAIMFRESMERKKLDIRHIGANN